MRILWLMLLCWNVLAEPQQDLRQLRQYYQQLFPQLSLQDYADGVYALDAVARQSWQEIEQFPPYELAIEQGELLFKQVLPNGKHYRDCFPSLSIAHQYPQWDKLRGEVITLAMAINDCRVANQLKPLPYKKGQLAEILAYLAQQARGQTIDIKVPKDDSAAMAAYQQGKAYYYQRRGQLNFSCASCHVQNAGKKLRAELLSPALGHSSHWPSYRLKWGEMGTLHRRFIGCHRQIRAKIPTAQSVELRNLEYYLSFISNGLLLNAPSTRK